MSTQWKRRAAGLLSGMRRPRMGRRLVSLALSVAAMGLCVAVFDRNIDRLRTASASAERLEESE